MVDAAERLEGEPIRGEPVAVAAVDAAILVALVSIGRLSHGVGPVADPVGTAETLAPFVTGWIVASALANPYDARSRTVPATAARTTALCWLAAANVGIVLRSSPWFDGGVAWAFPAVITGLGLVALVGWRVAFAAIRNRA